MLNESSEKMAREKNLGRRSPGLGFRQGLNQQVDPELQQPGGRGKVKTILNSIEAFVVQASSIIDDDIIFTWVVDACDISGEVTVYCCNPPPVTPA